MEQVFPNRRFYTVGEYLAFEETSEAKHEYRDGEIIEMAGATDNHIRIARNLSRRLDEKLQGSSCETFGSDLRVRTDRTRYCYPDQTVACRPLVFDPPDGNVVLTNPLAIFEILSPGTEASDRGEKFTRYRGIESLQEYFLVSQDRPQVEGYFRQLDGSWVIGGIVHGLESRVRIRSAGVEISLADLFTGVSFSSPVHEAICAEISERDQ